MIKGTQQAAFERTMEQDRTFFERNRKQDYFIRDITPPEIADITSQGGSVGADASVLVGSLAVGARTRLVFEKSAPPPIAEFRETKRAIAQAMKTTKPKARSSTKGFARTRTEEKS